MNLRTLRSAELRTISDFIADLREPVASTGFGNHLVMVCGRHLRDFAHMMAYDETRRCDGHYELHCNRMDELRAYDEVLRHHIAENPGWRYVMAGGSERVMMITDFMSQREFRRTGLYRNVFQPMGGGYQLAVAIATSTHVGGLTLHRDRPIRETMRAIATLLAPHIERAHAQAQRRAQGGDGLPAAALVALGLTPREAEVLHWIAEGKRDAEIAIILGVAYRTVCKNVERILAKLGIENRVAAVTAAREALRA